MSHTEQAEHIKILADSLAADKLERDRLKKLADETLAGLHRAVREFVRRPTGDRDARSS